LQINGLNTGAYFLKSLRKIQSKFPHLISEVRGRGLFIGIDLIKDKENTPNAKLATLIINKMRDRGILLSTDGPYHNVIKIKPPMPFNKNNSDLVSFELEDLLNNI
jgi:4-aminobutyrate aminotransferase-like enzyme